MKGLLFCKSRVEWLFFGEFGPYLEGNDTHVCHGQKLRHDVGTETLRIAVKICWELSTETETRGEKHGFCRVCVLLLL